MAPAQPAESRRDKQALIWRFQCWRHTLILPWTHQKNYVVVTKEPRPPTKIPLAPWQSARYKEALSRKQIAKSMETETKTIIRIANLKKKQVTRCCSRYIALSYASRKLNKIQKCNNVQKCFEISTIIYSRSWEKNPFLKFRFTFVGKQRRE